MTIINTSTKEEALRYIKDLISQGVITKEELNKIDEQKTEVKNGEKKKFEITDILYYVGGGIVFLGIFILVAQNWDDFGVVTKLLITFGSAIMAYAIGVFLNYNEKTKSVSNAFYLISALIAPIGFWVLSEDIMHVSSNESWSLIWATMFIIYLSSYFIFKKNIFVLFSIIFGTNLVFSFTNILFDNIFYDWRFDFYRVMIVGYVYMVLGYYFSKGKQSILTGVLYLFGVFGVLASALSLGGWQPDQNLFWELIYPVLVFGALFLSVNLRSKVFLTWGSLFLVAYIAKITNEYFADSMSWPLMLVIIGFAIIGTGYLFFTLKKKYL